MTQEIKDQMRSYKVMRENGSFVYVNMDNICAMIFDKIKKTCYLSFHEGNIDISGDDKYNLFSFMGETVKLCSKEKHIWVPFKCVESFGYDHLSHHYFVVTNKLGKMVIEDYVEYEILLKYFDKEAWKKENEPEDN